MRFIYTGTGMIEDREAVEASNWAIEKMNEFSDWFVGKEVELVLAPAGAALKEMAIDLWQWFIVNLPDIMGYTTILAGIIIILGSMIGKGGMIKPLAGWAGLMILALCILGGV